MNNPTRDPTIVKVILEDIMQVAFMKLKGYSYRPWISDDDPRDPQRVSFEIEGEEEKLNADMQGYYDNWHVGIQDLNRAYKDAKSIMYTMRKTTKK